MVKLALHSSEEALTTAIRCYGPWGWLATRAACIAVHLKLYFPFNLLLLFLVKSVHFAAMEIEALEEIIHIRGGTAATLNTITSLTRSYFSHCDCYTHLGIPKFRVPL